MGSGEHAHVLTEWTESDPKIFSLGNLSMTKQRNKLAALFAACWKDEALKARFMSDPKGVLAEFGMAVPDGIDVNVVENSDNCVHLTIPAVPVGNVLSDEELGEVAGGMNTDNTPDNAGCIIDPSGVPW